MTYPLLVEALRLQEEAREMLAEQQRGVDDAQKFTQRAEGWATDRHILAEHIPQTAVDTLALLHSLRQASLGLLAMRDRPEVVTLSGLELTTGIWALIQKFERDIGLTREQIGLVDQPSPPPSTVPA